jgi:hypothetical protein
VLVCAAVIAFVPAAISFAVTMLEPSNSSFGIRSVEWLRDHGAASLVTKVENVYYTLNAPAKGGPALRALPRVGVSSSGTRTAASAVLPTRIRPLTSPALPGEGVWHRTSSSESRIDPPLLVSTFRNEPLEYPRLVAGVAWINTSRAKIALYAGRQEPSVALPSRGEMEVPHGLWPHLLATFNSGFKMTDARGGWALYGHAYAPMQAGEATFLRYRDGRYDVMAWNGGAQVPRDVVFARQNLPLIVDHGRPNPNLSDGPEWGATLGNAVRVWRSGIGVDRRGNLIYAAANDQTVGSLARTLIHAGAIRAMELDINSYWVSFISYGSSGAQDPSNLLSGMERTPYRYLTADDRDFFAVYER